MTPPTGAVLTESAPDRRTQSFGPARTASSVGRNPSLAVLAEYQRLTGWGGETLSRIRNLRWLSAGWDGPDSPAMDLAAVEHACRLISHLAAAWPDLRPPTVTPTPDAGVFIEWYSPIRSVAFTVRGQDVDLCYEDTTSGDDWEGQFGNLPNDDWLRILATIHR